MRNAVSSDCKLKILSLSLNFPNNDEPNMGTFVRSRLQAMATSCEIKVVAPIPLLDYGRIRSTGWRGSKQVIPKNYLDGPLEIFHPRWFYLPVVGALNPLFLFLFLLPKIWAIKRRFAFQVIDAHSAYPCGVAAALLASVMRCSFTVTLRGDETRQGNHLLRRSWMRWTLCRADHVITVSERLREFAIELGAGPERSTTIPNGIDATIYYPRIRTVLRSKHRIPADAKMLLSAGYLIYRKGHHKVIEAVHKLRADGMDVRLWIAGGPGREKPCHEALRSMVGQLGLEDHVLFVGPLAPETLAEYMAAADVFCLASTREGWPNVVHEALGCGTPVVATDVGGVPSLIPSDEHGFVVASNDQRALEEALRKALLRRWDQHLISERAQARSWAQVADEVAIHMRMLEVRGRYHNEDSGFGWRWIHRLSYLRASTARRP